MYLKTVLFFSLQFFGTCSSNTFFYFHLLMKAKVFQKVMFLSAFLTLLQTNLHLSLLFHKNFFSSHRLLKVIRNNATNLIFQTLSGKLDMIDKSSSYFANYTLKIPYHILLLASLISRLLTVSRTQLFQYFPALILR